MPEQFMQGIVRIVNDRGEVGTGFVVSVSGLIATCSHVIQHEDLQERLPRPEKVKVLFYMTGDELDARVEPDWWLPCKAGDLAILSLEGALPPGIQPLVLGSSKGTDGHDISTFGFPNIGDIAGIGGDGKVVQLLLSSERTLIQLRSNEITAGFSGAPIWNKLTQRVIGVVSEIANPDPNFRLLETVFALSAEMLQNLCPLLQISDICPYLGLAAFQEADAKFFFGRQPVIDSILNRVRQEPHFLIVLGPSGSGKSSVMQAGFIPQLKTGKIPMSNRWGVFIMRPADDPFAALAKQGFADGTYNLIENVEAWLHLHSKQERLVLIFDQFEEVFVTCPEGILQSFVEQITQLLHSSQPISVILVMRDDFYSRMAQHEALMEWVAQSGGPFQIPQHINERELKDIVQKPAEEIGLRFEKGLVDVIVRDTMETALEDGSLVGRSAVLPLLESALHELWKERNEGMLTHKAYKEIGAVVGALNRRAEQAFFELKEEHRQLARRVFTDLIYLGNKNQGILDSRRRRTLAALSRQDQEQQDVEYVVHHLAEDRHRLLVTDRDTQTCDETVEIIHDVLLRRWGMLKQWIKDDQEFLQWHQEVEKPVQVWREQGDKNRLLKGRDLREAKKQMEKHRTDLSQDEVAFLRASAKYSVNLFVRTMVVVLLLVSLTGATGWYYLHQAADPTLVTTLTNDGVGSLRWAIDSAPSGKTITFASRLAGQTITLTDKLFITNKQLHIQGPQRKITLSNARHGIEVDVGAAIVITNVTVTGSRANSASLFTNHGKLSLMNSTVSGNTASNSNGGGIYNDGTVTLTNSTVSGNTASDSGGIYNNNGTVRLMNSTVSGNTASKSNGGGIYNNGNGTVTLMNSTVSGNAASTRIGGGIYNNNGTVCLTNSTVSGNTASDSGGIYNNNGTVRLTNSTVSGNTALGNTDIIGGDSGGGIYNDGMVTLTNSTVSGNTALTGNGGGIYNDGPMMTLTNSTVSGNTALTGNGGGIENFGGLVTLTFCTLYGNHARIGGGLSTEDDNTDDDLRGNYGTSTMLNSLVAGNQASPDSDTAGKLTTKGYNLIQNATSSVILDPDHEHLTDHFNIPGSKIKVDPNLRLNGSTTTKTDALLSGSFAIDAIPRAACLIVVNGVTITTDQRGIKRPQGSACDIGAYEYIS